MMFQDRTDAGKRLAEVVKRARIDRPVVLGIPRGGLPLAAEVARATGGDLSAIVARKLGAPGNPELAIGATTADGVYYLNEETARLVGAGDDYIAAERERQSREAARREALFDSQRRPNLAGRNVIIVDDGLATGATAIASVRSAKAAGAARVILAVPVGPPHTVERLSEEADEVICLVVDPWFTAVGQFYEEFDPVEDEEVIRILRSFAPSTVADPSRTFTVVRDGVRLAGTLRTPGGAGPFPAVVFVHGLGSSKDSPRNVVIAEALVDAGVAAVLFDLSGHGDSASGPREDVHTYVEDLEAVFVWASQQADLDASRLGLAGSSLGGVVAVQAAGRGLVRPRAMVLRAPPVDPAQFARLDVPSLVIIGSHDQLLPEVSQAAARCAVAKVTVVPGASHLFEEPGTLEEAVKLTVQWFTERLAARQPAAPGRRDRAARA